MAAVVLTFPHHPARNAIVRDAVNERARLLASSEQRRNAALSAGFRALEEGRSVAWAVSAALRALRVDPPMASAPQRPTPPEAA